MIKITFMSGVCVKWRKDEYTDYIYNGKTFVVIKNKAVVGIYNINCVSNIVIDDEDGNMCIDA